MTTTIEIEPATDHGRMEVVTATHGTLCRLCYRLRDSFIGTPSPPNIRATRFEMQCRVLMCMQEPVAGLLACTVAYIWICGLHHHGSDPFIQNLPVFLGIGPNRTTDTSAIAVASLWNSLFLLSTVVFTTILFLVLFTYKCRRICFSILMGAFLLTTTAAPIYLTWKACVRYHIVLDWFSVCLFTWNFSVVGTLLVHWEWLHATLEAYHDKTWSAVSDSPLNAHNWIVHVYLVLNAVGLTWPFSSMDEWTVWSFLILLVLWDLFAVLTPCGPLRYIMTLERTRRKNGVDQFKLPPGLIYETSLFQLGTGDLLFYGVIFVKLNLLKKLLHKCACIFLTKS